MRTNHYSKLILVLISLTIVFGSSHFCMAAISAAERTALIALYESTNGDNWDDNTGWKTPPLEADGFAPIRYGVYLVWCRVRWR